MCSRYNLTSPPEAVRAYFGYADTPNFPARYNIAPTQGIPVVLLDETGARRFRLMRWGLVPVWSKDLKVGYRMINAKKENLLKSRAYAPLFTKPSDFRPDPGRVARCRSLSPALPGGPRSR